MENDCYAGMTKSSLAKTVHSLVTVDFVDYEDNFGEICTSHLRLVCQHSVKLRVNLQQRHDVERGLHCKSISERQISGDPMDNLAE